MKEGVINAAGNQAGTVGVNKFGENQSIAQNTTEDVWDGGGTYAYPATALMTSMSQTVDQVTMRGGAISIEGLDVDWEPVIQTALLDATLTTTVVTLDTPLIRVNRMSVIVDVITTQDIRCHNAGETIDYAIISTGNNQTQMALYTVPNGFTAYMTNYYAAQVLAAAGAFDPNNVEFKLWAADRDNGYFFQLKHSRPTTAAKTDFQHFFEPHPAYTQKTDLRMSATVSNDKAAHVHAGFDLELVSNRTGS